MKTLKSKQIKAICRKLPPRLTNAQFNEQFQKWISKSLFSYYVSGDHKYFLLNFKFV